jgi:hypothetical protein
MGQSMKKVERWKMEMPTEAEMLPKDKYTVFDRKVKRYRKGIHSKSHTPSGRGHAVRAKRASGSPGKVWWLTFRRGAKVDKSQPTTQSSGFLDGPYRERRSCACVYHVSLYNLHQIRRFGKQYIPPKHTLAISCSLNADVSALSFDERRLLV